MSSNTSTCKMKSCASAVLAAVLLYDVACTRVVAMTEVGSSIVLAVDTDYLPYDGENSKCTDMVAKVAQLNTKRIQIVPTLFWVDNGPKNGSIDCTGAYLERYYCYNRFNATTIKTFTYKQNGGTVSQADIDRFQSAMALCFKRAVDAGLDLTLNFHIDDGLGLGGWRNTLLFDPTEKYSGFSYVDVVLTPFANALNSAIKEDTRVWVVPQGETGATVFFYPRQWLTVSNQLKDRIVQGKPASWRSHVFVLMGLNNAKICGCLLIPIIDHDEYLAKLPRAFAPVKNEFDFPALQALFDGVDGIGISAYIPQRTPNFTTCDIERLLVDLDTEAAFWNLNFKDLSRRGKQIHFIEYGVGGGTSGNGTVKATTAEEAAYTPFFGMSGPYTKANDPFRLYDPAPNPVREYDRYFYNQTAQYLRRGGCQYSPSAVHIWNLPSWDVQGIYHGSTTSEGSYRDEVIVKIIDEHNRLAHLTNETRAVPSNGTAERGTTPSVEQRRVSASSSKP